MTSYKKTTKPVTFNQLLTCSEDPNEDREDRIPHFSAGKRSIISGLMNTGAPQATPVLSPFEQFL